MTTIRTGMPQVAPRNRKAWRNWLAKNHNKSGKIWLVIPKKNSGLPAFTMAEAVEEALCFGWIDSVANPIDDKRYKVMFSPRNPKSSWSAINKARVKALTKQGLMQQAGTDMVELAKKTGTWTALEKIDNLEYPEDLVKAFSRNKKASKNFENFSPSVKKMILHWILSAKRPDTRTKRIGETISMAAKGLKANQWTKKA